MKKRLLMILLVVALLVTAAVFAVQADTETPTDPRLRPCPCSEHNGAAPTLDEWTDWTSSVHPNTNKTDAVQHWYVSASLYPTAVYSLSNGKENVVCIPSGKDINCDKSARCFQVNGATTVVHLVGDGRICGAGLAGNAGGIIRVNNNGTLYIHDNVTIYKYGANQSTNGGLITVQSGGALYMDGGALAANYCNVTGSGGAVHVQNTNGYKNSTFTMTGGTINARASVVGSHGGAIYNEGGDTTIGGSANILGLNTDSANFGGAIYVSAGTLNIQGGTISGGKANQGGNIYVAAGTFSITGGTIKDGYATVIGGNIVSQVNFTIANATISGGRVSDTTGYGGAIVAPGKTVTMTSGTIDGGVVNGEAYTGKNAFYGGAIYAPSGTFNMQGGTIQGFAADQGGVVYITKGTVNLGGTVTARSATDGGIAYINKGETGSVTFSGTITGCTVTGNGGVAYVGEGATGTVNVTGGTITGGNATNGGAIYMGAGTFNMTSGTITDATATGNGGAINSLGTLNIAGTITNCSAGGNGGAIYAGNGFTMSGSITNCSAASGGAIYIPSGKTGSMTGGSISDCSATGRGGAVFVTSGTFNMSGNASVTVKSSETDKHSPGVYAIHSTVNMSDNAQVTGLGTAGGSNAYAMYIITYNTNGPATATLKLSGNAKVTAAQFSRNIKIYSYTGVAGNVSKLEVDPNWNGEASVDFDGCGVNGDHNELLSTTYAVATGAYSGNLRLENGNDLRPGIFFDEDESALRVSGVYVKDADVEGIQWQANNAAAVTAAGNDANSVIHLLTNAALDLAGKTVYVDFLGQSVEVSDSVGGGKLYGIDTETDFEGAAAATVTGVAPEPFAVYPLNENVTYVALNDHFYPIALGIDGVGLRPSTAGIYFAANVVYNPAIAECIDGYGLAATLGGDITADFDEQIEVKYTLSEGAPSSSMVGYINKIPDGADPKYGKIYGEAPVKARAYIILSNGIDEMLLLSTQEEASLKSTMTYINEVWDEAGKLTTEQMDAVWDLYDRYEVTKDWDLTNIASYK